jgi:ABC-type amino acid transport substrate-binding protein
MSGSRTHPGSKARKLRIGTVALALSLLVTAMFAGGSQGAKSSKTAANPYNLQTPGQLVVGMDLVQKPQFYLTPSGKPAGFDYTLLVKLAKDMGVKLVVKNLAFAGLIPGIQAKKFDIASDDLSDTPAREEVVSFSRGYFPNQIILAVPAKSTTPATIAAWNDSSMSITGEAGSVDQDAVTGSFPKAHFEGFPDNNGALLQVSTGRADASVVEVPILTNFQASNPGELKALVFPNKVLPAYYGSWATQKGNTALDTYLSKWICTNFKNGFIPATYKHFLGTAMPKLPGC